MQKIFFTISALFLLATADLKAQDDVYPAVAYKGKLFIVGGTIHVGNGQIIEGGAIEVDNGKIVQVAQHLPVPQGEVRVIDASGKQVYPGLILPVRRIWG